MNTSPSVTNPETRSKTYFTAAVFLLPALSLWIVAQLFLQPKLELLWSHAGAAFSHAQWVMDTSRVVMHSGGLAFAAVAVVLILLELRFSIYRRLVVGAVVFLLNSAVLVGLTAMCLSLLLAVPSLR